MTNRIFRVLRVVPLDAAVFSDLFGFYPHVRDEFFQTIREFGFVFLPGMAENRMLLPGVEDRPVHALGIEQVDGYLFSAKLVSKKAGDDVERLKIFAATGLGHGGAVEEPGTGNQDRFWRFPWSESEPDVTFRNIYQHSVEVGVHTVEEDRLALDVHGDRVAFDEDLVCEPFGLRIVSRKRAADFSHDGFHFCLRLLAGHSLDVEEEGDSGSLSAELARIRGLRNVLFNDPPYVGIEVAVFEERFLLRPPRTARGIQFEKRRESDVRGEFEEGPEAVHDLAFFVVVTYGPPERPERRHELRRRLVFTEEFPERPLEGSKDDSEEQFHRVEGDVQDAFREEPVGDEQPSEVERPDEGDRFHAGRFHEEAVRRGEEVERVEVRVDRTEVVRELDSQEYVDREDKSHGDHQQRIYCKLSKSKIIHST